MRLGRHTTILLTLLFLFLVLWVCAVFVWDLPHLAGIHANGVEGDSGEYDAGAMSLLRHGIYSVDGGMHTFHEREIGYSLFIAAVYLFAGLGNYLALFVAQTLFFLLALFTFERQLRRVIHPTASIITVALMLFLPSVLLTQLVLLRESVALSVLLFFAAALLRLKEKPSIKIAIIAGICIGYGMLVYAPLLLLPLFLIVFTKWLKIPFKKLCIVAVTAYAILLPWLIRNQLETGMPCPTGCYRNALQWYVRGVRSENIRGFEPYRCLWSEYISRDWTGRSPYCSFNGTWHAKWPHGFVGTPADAIVSRQGQMLVLQYLPYYLWDSVSEVVEFHIPYVGPWGRTYNLSESLGLLIVYLGCLCALPVLFRREHRLFLTMAVYCILLFALTDAIPRYHMPVIFCYAVLGGVGYHRLLTRPKLCQP